MLQPAQKEDYHLTSRAWYRSEAWKPAIITQPSSLSENDWNAGDWSSKTRDQDPFSPPSISPEFGHTFSWVLLLTSPASFSNQPRHLQRSDCQRLATRKAHGLGSSIRHLSSFTEVPSSLTGKGILVISQSKGNFVISDFVGILVIAEIEDKVGNLWFWG